MKTNPYTELLEMILQENGSNGIHMIRGTVKTVSPFLVDVGGTDQEAERFYLCSRAQTLYAGDSVLLLTEDYQTFFLIDKVVHL